MPVRLSDVAEDWKVSLPELIAAARDAGLEFPDPRRAELSDDQVARIRARLGADRPSPLNEHSTMHSLSDESTIGGARPKLGDLASGHPGESGAIEDRYELLQELGHGGMGVVWKAQDKRLKRVVAIKRLKGAQTETAARLLLEEAQKAAQLSHINIVRVIDSGEDSRGPWLIMEYVDGQPLSDIIRRDRRLAVERAVEISRQLADALEAAHQAGLLHRDIKPGNVLLSKGDVPKLLDFGLAHAADDQKSPGSDYVGTPAYMAPEQAVDSRRADERSDLWSLAGTLFTMLTGEVPRQFEAAKVPDSVRAVLTKALQEHPDRRYRSMREFREALDGVQRELSVTQSSAPIVAGKCVNCGEKNAPDRKFCRKCGETLSEPCLKCNAENLAGEQFCGKCGGDLAGLVRARQLDLESKKQQVMTFRGSFRLPQARTLLGEIAQVSHPRLKSTGEWARQELSRLEAEIAQWQETEKRQLAAARAAIAAGKTALAVQAAQEIPAPLQSADLAAVLEEATAKENDVAQLAAHIKQAWTSKQYAGLLPSVERFLKLRPGDSTMQKMAEKLRGYEDQRALKDKQGLLQSARDSIGKKEYSAAIAVLERIPAPGRDEAWRTLHGQATGILREVASLRDEACNPGTPEPKAIAAAQKWLVLVPGDPDATRQLEALQRRGKRSAAMGAVLGAVAPVVGAVLAATLGTTPGAFLLALPAFVLVGWLALRGTPGAWPKAVVAGVVSTLLGGIAIYLLATKVEPWTAAPAGAVLGMMAVLALAGTGQRATALSTALLLTLLIGGGAFAMRSPAVAKNDTPIDHTQTSNQDPTPTPGPGTANTEPPGPGKGEEVPPSPPPPPPPPPYEPPPELVAKFQPGSVWTGTEEAPDQPASKVTLTFTRYESGGKLVRGVAVPEKNPAITVVFDGSIDWAAGEGTVGTLSFKGARDKWFLKESVLFQSFDVKETFQIGADGSLTLVDDRHRKSVDLQFERKIESYLPFHDTLKECLEAGSHWLGTTKLKDQAAVGVRVIVAEVRDDFKYIRLLVAKQDDSYSGVVFEGAVKREKEGGFSIVLQKRNSGIVEKESNLLGERNQGTLELRPDWDGKTLHGRMDGPEEVLLKKQPPELGQLKLNSESFTATIKKLCAKGTTWIGRASNPNYPDGPVSIQFREFNDDGKFIDVLIQVPGSQGVYAHYQGSLAPEWAVNYLPIILKKKSGMGPNRSLFDGSTSGRDLRLGISLNGQRLWGLSDLEERFSLTSSTTDPQPEPAPEPMQGRGRPKGKGKGQ